MGEILRNNTPGNTLTSQEYGNLGKHAFFTLLTSAEGIMVGTYLSRAYIPHQGRTFNSRTGAMIYMDQESLCLRLRLHWCAQPVKRMILGYRDANEKAYRAGPIRTSDDWTAGLARAAVRYRDDIESRAAAELHDDLTDYVRARRHHTELIATAGDLLVDSLPKGITYRRLRDMPHCFGRGTTW